MGPAGTAVLRDVLVADVGDVIDTIDVVPVPLSGQVVDWLQRGLDSGLGSVARASAAGSLRVDSAEGSEGDSAKKGSDSEVSHSVKNCFNYY